MTKQHARVMFHVHCTSVGHKFPIHQVWNWYIETLLRQLPNKNIWKKEFTPKTPDQMCVWKIVSVSSPQCISVTTFKWICQTGTTILPINANKQNHIPKTAFLSYVNNVVNAHLYVILSLLKTKFKMDTMEINWDNGWNK